MRNAAKIAMLFAALLVFIAASPRSSERRAVLDALRPEIEAKLGPGVEFVVQACRVENGWAFVIADPLRKGGAPIDGDRIFGADFENMDGLRVDAVLRRRDGRWTVADWGMGATDVWYCEVGPRSLKRGYGC
jgi:hypothetical protein